MIQNTGAIGNYLQSANQGDLILTDSNPGFTGRRLNDARNELEDLAGAFWRIAKDASDIELSNNCRISAMNCGKYENVKYIIQVFFDQGWKVSARTDKEAIALLCERFPSKEVPEIAGEINCILLGLFEEIYRMLKDFHCGYAYRRVHDMDGIGWLLRLRSYLTSKN